MNVKTHIELLGKEAKDRVTGYTGIVTSVSFDLYGCLQCILQPKAKNDGREFAEARWLDANRPLIISEARVLELPPFDFSIKEEYLPDTQNTHGPEYKPVK